MMDSNRIFVDTNVIIGAWAGNTDDDRCLKYLFSLNVFISRCSAFGEMHYFEHNEPLVEQEIALIKHFASELN